VGEEKAGLVRITERAIPPRGRGVRHEPFANETRLRQQKRMRKKKKAVTLSIGISRTDRKGGRGEERKVELERGRSDDVS